MATSGEIGRCGGVAILGLSMFAISACSSDSDANDDPDGVYTFEAGNWTIQDTQGAAYDKWTNAKGEAMFVTAQAKLRDGLTTETWCREEYTSFRGLFTSGVFSLVSEPESVDGAAGWWWWVAKDDDTQVTNYKGYLLSAPHGLDVQIFNDSTDMSPARAAEILSTLKFR
jgi:hypothetical protein